MNATWFLGFTILIFLVVFLVVFLLGIRELEDNLRATRQHILMVEDEINKKLFRLEQRLELERKKLDSLMAMTHKKKLGDEFWG